MKHEPSTPQHHTELNKLCCSGINTTDHLVQLFDLLKRGANPNITNSTGGYPLILLANQSKHQDLATRGVAYLLSKGARVNRHSPNGASPLLYAARAGNARAVELLLEAGATASDRFSVSEEYQRAGRAGATTIHMAADSGSGELIELLIAHGANPHALDQNDENALFAAARGSNPSATQALLKHTVNPNQVNSSLDKSIENFFGLTPLHCACAVAITPPLTIQNLNYGWDEDGKVTHMTSSSKTYDVEEQGYSICRLLLENAADPNIENPSGFTALAYAVRRDKLRFAELLLEYGANPKLPAVVDSICSTAMRDLLRQ